MSLTMYKYPCGCIGLGFPPVETEEAGEVVWKGVPVVHSCVHSCDWDDDGFWHLPGCRDLAASRGAADALRLPPSPLVGGPASYEEFLVRLQKDAQKWRDLGAALRPLMS